MTSPGIPLTRLYIVTGAFALFATLYAMLDLQPGVFMELLLLFGPPVAVATWLAADARTARFKGIYDSGLFFSMTWLVTAPWYLVSTRGRRGWWIAAQLYGLSAASLFGVLWGSLLRSIFLEWTRPA